MVESLDKYDRKILAHLDVDARRSASSISKEVKLPKETVNYRIQRLLKNGYIDHFYTIINASAVGYHYYRVYLKYQPIQRKDEQHVVSYLYSHTQCANLRITEGAYDLVFLAIVRSVDELKSFLDEFMERYGWAILEKSIQTIVTSYKMNQKFIYPLKSVRNVFHHTEQGTETLDTADTQILQLISKNARMKLIDISRKIGIHSKMVSYHLKNLEQKGIIVSYATSLDLEQFDREFLQIDIMIKTPSVIPSIIEFFDSTNTCMFAYSTLGKYDLSLEIYVENDDQLRLIMNTFQDNYVDHYVQYEVTHIYKEFETGWSPFVRLKEKEK